MLNTKLTFNDCVLVIFFFVVVYLPLNNAGDVPPPMASTLTPFVYIFHLSSFWFGRDFHFCITWNFYNETLYKNRKIGAFVIGRAKKKRKKKKKNNRQIELLHITITNFWRHFLRIDYLVRSLKLAIDCGFFWRTNKKKSFLFFVAVALLIFFLLFSFIMYNLIDKRPFDVRCNVLFIFRNKNFKWRELFKRNEKYVSSTIEQSN